MCWRWSVLVGLACVLTPLSAMSSDAQDTPLAGTNFRQWTGLLSKTTLADNSILSEYVAHSFSSDDQGAALQIGFSPRFGCTPMVRIILPEQIMPLPSDKEPIRFLVDEVPFAFPAIVDTFPAKREFSYTGTSDAQQELRLLMDRSSHATVEGAGSSGMSDTGVDVTDSVKFSLLGSQMSVAAVEEHCNRHVAIAFEFKATD